MSLDSNKVHISILRNEYFGIMSDLPRFQSESQFLDILKRILTSNRDLESFFLFTVDSIQLIDSIDNTEHLLIFQIIIQTKFR